MSQIHITDGQTHEILDYITAKNIIDDNHKKSLEDTLETYDFITFADKRFSQHLEKRNRIIIPDEDETLREFVIFEAIKYRDSEGHKAQVFAHASYLELKKASIIYPNTFEGTASQHAGRSLNDTGWQVGIVEATGTRKLTIESHTNPYDFLKRLAKEFECELGFRVEHDGNRVTGRYVDLLERVGQWQGREVEFEKDLAGIRRVEKQDIVTALLGLGPEDEDGNRLEVLVEDEDALQRWGRVDEHGNLHHLIEPYEIQSERTEMTETEARQYTRTALDKRINTQVTYETTIIDLENVPGMENKKIRFGDTIRIKDTHFNPPLYIEARVFEQNRSIVTKAKKDIKLGDYIEYTEKELQNLWRQFRKSINKRLDRIAVASITSSAGSIFKNAQGTTELTARTFVGGGERDEDGILYDYQWMKFDKDGEHDTSFYEQGKTITVTANDITEKATYRVLIAYENEVITVDEITLSNVFDGSDGLPGQDGKDGEKGEKGDPGEDGNSSYTHVRYSQNANGSNMTTDPTNAVYIGIAITESPTAPTSASAYDWSKIKGDDGVAGEKGDDGKTSYVHIKYSNDGGQSFTGNNGEDPGDWIGTYTDFTEADSSNVNEYTWAKVKGDKGDTGEQGIPGDKGDPGEKGDPGQDGADGQSIIDIIPQYYKSNSKSSQTGGSWTETRPSFEPNKYLWTRNKNVYANPSKTEYTTPVLSDTWEALISADGKNTIFYQSTQPSTTNRKIGDTWFDTSRDNRMYRFDGSSWKASQFGEQAIVANSITANHIKSLVGLNVNDQFIVDSNGNVGFAGHLEGASGTFSGEVVGGSIKSNTTIDVTTDLKVGNNIYIGDYTSGHIDKTIFFNEGSLIEARDNHMRLASNSIYINSVNKLIMYLGHYLNSFIDFEDGELLISSDFGTTFNGNVKINSFDTPLWTGAVYLLNSHTVTPSKTLSECMTGWILRWQAYNVGEGVEQSNFQYTHIPKVTLQAGGRGHRLVLRRSGTMVTKYIYVYNDYLTGYEDNGQGDNRNLVLSGVFEY